MKYYLQQYLLYQEECIFDPVLPKERSCQYEQYNRTELKSLRDMH